MGKVLIPLVLVAVAALVWAMWPVSEEVQVGETEAPEVVVDTPSRKPVVERSSAGRDVPDNDDADDRRGRARAPSRKAAPNVDTVGVDDGDEGGAATPRRPRPSRLVRRMPQHVRIPPGAKIFDGNGNPVPNPEVAGPAAAALAAAAAGPGAMDAPGALGAGTPADYGNTDLLEYSLADVQSTVRDFYETFPKTGPFTGTVQAADVLPIRLIEELGINADDQILEFGDFPATEPNTYKEFLGRKLDEYHSMVSHGITVKTRDGQRKRIYTNLNNEN